MNNRFNFTEEQKKLLRQTHGKNCSMSEFEVFCYICEMSGLDPFMRQIWLVPRYDKATGKFLSQPLVSIDGFRLMAERTERYSPGQETKFNYDEKGQLISATAYIKKLTKDGTWHEVAAIAFYSEYVALTKEGIPTKFWAEKPHIMLAKCAEALALRRAFPQELSGLYTEEEMDRALQIKKAENKSAPISQEVIDNFLKKLNDLDLDLWNKYCTRIKEIKKWDQDVLLAEFRQKWEVVLIDFHAWKDKQNKPE